eukprot:TRINITY_DN19750_c0_g1_i1.p1 TRINITY_DN19750_c0_g1~~TRINITY_DN19750_c0_g1_i1.p1  ORF type:complete len:432 (+),score=79.21 TRINITY_DN19750_c0_g1_i1:43-1296(+)
MTHQIVEDAAVRRRHTAGPELFPTEHACDYRKLCEEVQLPSCSTSETERAHEEDSLDGATQWNRLCTDDSMDANWSPSPSQEFVQTNSLEFAGSPYGTQSQDSTFGSQLCASNLSAYQDAYQDAVSADGTDASGCPVVWLPQDVVQQHSSGQVSPYSGLPIVYCPVVMMPFVVGGMAGSQSEDRCSPSSAGTPHSSAGGDRHWYLHAAERRKATRGKKEAWQHQQRQQGKKGQQAAAAAAPKEKVDSKISGSPDLPIVRDEERTTIMLRNLPKETTRKSLMETLDKHGYAKSYDFLYLPRDFKEHFCIFGYAFVNFLSNDMAAKARELFDGFQDWDGKAVPLPVEAHWGHPLQGLDAHIERYRDSPIMSSQVPDECRPIILKDGVRVAFPEPRKALRLPRRKGMYISAARRLERSLN